MRTMADRYFSLKSAADGGGVVLFPDSWRDDITATQCHLIAASSGIVTGTFSGSSFTELTIKATKPGVLAIYFYLVGKTSKTSGWESAVLPVTLKNDKAFVEPDTTWVPKGDRVGGIDNATSVWVKIGDVVYSSTTGVLRPGMARVPDANLLLSFLNGDEGVTEETVVAAAQEHAEEASARQELPKMTELCNTLGQYLREIAVACKLIPATTFLGTKSEIVALVSYNREGHEERGRRIVELRGEIESCEATAQQALRTIGRERDTVDRNLERLIGKLFATYVEDTGALKTKLAALEGALTRTARAFDTGWFKPFSFLEAFQAIRNLLTVARQQGLLPTKK